jgi:hypothetical protein
MPKIEHWDSLPEGVRRHLVDRMRDRAISIADLNQLRLFSRLAMKQESLLIFPFATDLE